MLGYGFSEEQTFAALSSLVPTGKPTAIILDSGSTDSGPEKLALGNMTCPRSSYVRDLSKLIELVTSFRVPLIFSSSGGDGSDAHVKEMLSIIEEVLASDANSGIQLKTIAIFAGVEKALVKTQLQSGAISGCGQCVPSLTEEAIEQSTSIVAQLGPEPFLDAMTANPDFNIIVGGRAYDPSPYVAYAAFQSHTQLIDATTEKRQKLFGAFTHMGKVMECGGQCAQPKSAGAVGTLYPDGEFDIAPLDPKAVCTPLSVAAHTLYEKTRPDILHGPGGHFDLTKSNYEQLSDGRSVKVSGSTFHFSKEAGSPYTLKLEAARVVGYRTVFMGSIRDPIVIGQIDTLIETIKGYVGFRHAATSSQWKVDFHVHGRNTDEVFLIAEVLDDSQIIATSVASTARVATVMGPCAELSVYHLMNLEDGEERLHPLASHEPILTNGDIGDKLAIRHSIRTIGCWKSLSSASPTPQAIHADIKKVTAIDTSTASKGDSRTLGESLPRPTKVGDLAKVIRSKNAGPYEITFDIIFGSGETYSRVRDSGMLTRQTVAQAFGLPEEQIIWCGFFTPALAFKLTIPRIRNGKPAAAGGFLENDVHGSQQYLPLFNMKIPNNYF
ncbi:caib baif family enzyme [Seiridium cupressi]